MYAAFIKPVTVTVFVVQALSNKTLFRDKTMLQWVADINIRKQDVDNLEKKSSDAFSN